VQAAAAHALPVLNFSCVAELQSDEDALAQVSFGSQQSAVFSPQTSCKHGLILLFCENPAPQSPALHTAWSSQHSATVHDAESHAVVVERFVCVAELHRPVGALAHTSFAVQHSVELFSQTARAQGTVLLLNVQPLPQLEVAHDACAEQHSIAVHVDDSQADVDDDLSCVARLHNPEGAEEHDSLTLQHSLVSVWHASV
jgi:hypothetical protein